MPVHRLSINFMENPIGIRWEFEDDIEIYIQGLNLQERIFMFIY